MLEKPNIKVFIPNKGCHDHSDAERFGKLIFMSEGPMSRFAVSRAYREFAYCLCDSSPEDYLLVTGLTVAVSIACAIFSRLHGRLNLLLYKPSQVRGELGRYVERIIMMDELLDLRAKGKEVMKDVRSDQEIKKSGSTGLQNRSQER